MSGWEAVRAVLAAVEEARDSGVFAETPALLYSLGSFFVFLSQMNEQFRSAPKFTDILLRGTSHQPMDYLAVATEG